MGFTVGSAGSVTMNSIYCPAYDEYGAFRSYFNFDPNVVARYQRNLPYPDWRGNDTFVFRSPPPYGAGLDPLRGIDKSPHLKELAKLDETARQIDYTDLKKNIGLIGEELLEGELGEAGKKTLKELKNVCYVFSKTVEKKYDDNFVKLCNEAHESSERAIAAADQAGKKTKKFVASYGRYGTIFMD
ncbi:hypothetical protein FOZ61_002736 [Perkinsus olseni]|uniref:Uncharacterized protein n=1 Tax=Perkinsus olseni TaxID=32597 RepID=A0A7J6LS56_PEROL|nr:hypothetical protein FOZ61_002736 [Perkinsus olseni]